MADSEKKTIIALFAHPDDELGAVGTLANHVQRGDRVILAWTTKGELTTFLEHLDVDEVKRERMKHGEEIRKILGAEKIHFFDFGDSMVSSDYERRVKVAKFYSTEKPDAVISWGKNNSHADHKNTSLLALEAIQAARIRRVVNMEPHRSNVKFLSYFEKESVHPIKYIDVKEVMEIVIECGNYYGDIYGWKSVEKWMKHSRISKGMESGVEFAEKFNVRFEYPQVPRYLV